MKPALLLLAFVARPLFTPPDLQTVADRAHGFTVLVVSRAAGEEKRASGVLIRGGLVLTDLNGLVSPGADGSIAPRAEIVVVIDHLGPLPAALAGGDTDLGIAVLRLPDVAKKVPGASIATEDPAVADNLVAMGTDGTVVDVLGVKVDHVESGARLRTSSVLPETFRGGPLFDVHGDLAALELPLGAAIASSVLRLLEQQ